MHQVLCSVGRTRFEWGLTSDKAETRRELRGSTPQTTFARRRMKKQRNVTPLTKNRQRNNSATMSKGGQKVLAVDRCICVHTSCFKRAGCEMRLPGLLADRV